LGENAPGKPGFQKRSICRKNAQPRAIFPHWHCFYVDFQDDIFFVVPDFRKLFEVFPAARLDEWRRREEPFSFEVFLIAEFDGPAVASRGMIRTS